MPGSLQQVQWALYRQTAPPSLPKGCASPSPASTPGRNAQTNNSGIGIPYSKHGRGGSSATPVIVDQRLLLLESCASAPRQCAHALGVTGCRTRPVLKCTTAAQPSVSEWFQRVR